MQRLVGSFVGNFLITSGEGTELVLDIQRRTECGTPCLQLSGEVDRSNVERFSAALEEVFSEDRHRVVLDFTHLVFLDSAAISVIFRTLALLSPEDWLAVLNPAPSILRLLQLVGLPEIANFRVFVSRQEMHIALG